MPNKQEIIDYWNKRAVDIEQSTFNQTSKYAVELGKQYKRAELQVKKEINQYVSRFAENNSLSMAQARKLLSSGELDDFKITLADYIAKGKEGNLSEEWIKKLENASLRARISQKEALQLEIENTVHSLMDNMGHDFESVLKKGFDNSFGLTSGSLGGSKVVNADLLESIISKPWAIDGKTFSKRVWENEGKLIKQLEQDMNQYFMLGKSPNELIVKLEKDFGVSRSQAQRLVITEGSYFHNKATLEAYKRNGIEKYQVDAVIDGKTSEICKEMDGTVWKLDEAQVGINYPPFHPNCRTTVKPYFDDDLGEDTQTPVEDNKEAETAQKEPKKAKETLPSENQITNGHDFKTYEDSYAHDVEGKGLFEWADEILQYYNDEIIPYNLSDNYEDFLNMMSYSSDEKQFMIAYKDYIEGNITDLSSIFDQAQQAIAKGDTFMKFDEAKKLYDLDILNSPNQTEYESMLSYLEDMYYKDQKFMKKYSTFEEFISDKSILSEGDKKLLIQYDHFKHGVKENTVSKPLIYDTDKHTFIDINTAKANYNLSALNNIDQEEFENDLSTIQSAYYEKEKNLLKYSSFDEFVDNKGYLTADEKEILKQWDLYNKHPNANMKVESVAEPTPKKEVLTKKKLQEKITTGDLEIEKLKQEFKAEANISYDTAESILKNTPSENDYSYFGYEGNKLDKLNDIKAQIDKIEQDQKEWQAKIELKAKKSAEAKEKKALGQLKLDLEDKKKIVQQQLDDFEVKTYKNIWKNDVTTKDYVSKKEAIDKKKNYFNMEKLHASSQAEIDKFDDLLKQLDDFEQQGIAYEQIADQMKDIEKQLDDISDKLNKKVNSKAVVGSGFTSNSYSQARKDSAIWAKDTKEADNVLRSKCGEVWRSISEDQKDALFDYTISYSKYNESLRGIEYGTNKYIGMGKVDLDMIGVNYKGFKKGEIHKKINDITNAIAKSTYKEDFWLQRGVHYKGMDKFFNVSGDLLRYGSQDELEKALLGKTVTDGGFFSCGVAKGRGFSGDIILNVYAPSGTQMMYAEPYSNYGRGSGRAWDGLKKQSAFGGESEIILQQGTSFRVTKVEKNFGSMYIDLEVISQTPQY